MALSTTRKHVFEQLGCMANNWEVLALIATDQRESQTYKKCAAELCEYIQQIKNELKD